MIGDIEAFCCLQFCCLASGFPSVHRWVKRLLSGVCDRHRRGLVRQQNGCLRGCLSPLSNLLVIHTTLVTANGRDGPSAFVSASLSHRMADSGVSVEVAGGVPALRWSPPYDLYATNFVAGAKSTSVLSALLR